MRSRSRGLRPSSASRQKLERAPIHSSSRATELTEQDLIRELAKLLDETNLTEIEVEREGLRVRVARQITTHVLAPGGAHVPTIPSIAPAPAIPSEMVDPSK